MAAQGKMVLDSGGAIVEILAQNILAVSRGDLDAWINTYGLPVTTVRDHQNTPTQTIDALVQREYTYLVDLRTMKIVQRYMGSTAGIGTSAAKTSMDALLKLLGH